jgi:hypothetical protein
LIKEEK